MNNMQQLYFGNLALDPNRQRRIVYYGRVSTEHEAQLEALESRCSGTRTKQSIIQIGLW